MELEAYSEMAEREFSHWFRIVRRDLIAQVIREHMGAGPLRILEVGSGTGGNIDMLSEFGHVTCVEMSEEGRALTRELHGAGIDMRAGAWPDPALVPLEEQFDLVLLLDVLEHLAEPVAALEAARARLAPGGRLVVTVPAYQWMWSHHDVFLHHQRRYSRAALLSELEKAGFAASYSSYFNTLLFPVAAAVRTMTRLTRRTSSPGSKTPNARVNTALATVFRQERRWVGRRSAPFGLSLVAVGADAAPGSR